MLNPQTAAQIKACQYVYTVRDTARHFGVSPDTVSRIWRGMAHTDVPEAPEAPNVISTRVSPDVIAEDSQRLLERGLSITEAAQQLGVSASTIRRYAPCLLVF